VNFYFDWVLDAMDLPNTVWSFESFSQIVELLRQNSWMLLSSRTVDIWTAGRIDQPKSYCKWG